MKADRPRSGKSDAGKSQTGKSASPKSPAVKSADVNRIRRVKPSTSHAAGTNGQSPRLRKSTVQAAPAPTSAAGRKAKGKNTPARARESGRPRHLTSVFDLAPKDVEAILAISADLKGRHASRRSPATVAGARADAGFRKAVAADAQQLRGGGDPARRRQRVSHDAGRRTQRSRIAARRGPRAQLVFRRLVMRTFSQSLIEEFARLSSCPVVNGLSDELHPCQALTDLFTIQETFGRLAGVRLATSATATTWPRRWRWRRLRQDARDVLLAATDTSFPTRFCETCAALSRPPT